jgi:hypothetical protein
LSEGVKQTPVIRLDAAGSIDTLTIMAVDHTQLALRNPYQPSNGIYASQPFSDSPIALYSKAQNSLITIDRLAATYSRASSFTITWRENRSGRVRRQIRLPYTPVAMPGAVRDSVTKYWIKRIMQSPTFGVRGEAAARAVVRRALFLPDYLPPVTYAFVDAIDRIWLKRESRSDGALWQIIGGDGRLVGTVLTDPRNRLLGSDGVIVWGEKRGEFDVPVLVKWQITK